jgi:hypothetical protein
VLGKNQQFYLPVGKDPLVGNDLLQPDQLGFHFLLFQQLGLVNQAAQFGDVFPQRNRVNRGDNLFQGI